MKRRTLLLSIALLASGCSQLTMTPPLLPASDVPSAFDHNATVAAWPAQDWWQGFGSSELAQLEAMALQANLDLAQADARLRQADARARQAGAALLPTVALNANVQHFTGNNGTSTGSEGDYFAGVGASYELDFWGKNRAGKLAADASLRASRADRATVALTVSAAVANGYFDLLALRERLALARDNVKSAQTIVAVVQRRVTAGYAAASDLTQARAALSAQQATVPALLQQELEARTALAILLGRPPEGFTVTADNMAGIKTPAVAPGLPVELLTRRPDLVTAEANLAGAHADIAAARAAMLPDITLTADAGLQNPALAAAVLTLENAGVTLTLGAALTQTIFDGGRLQARTSETEAREQELLAAYRAAVLAAFGDVENALGALGNLVAQERALADQVTQTEAVLRNAQRRYNAGAADMLVVTDAERSLYAARDQLADIRRARLAATVTLYKALGGGWQQD
ncbi:MAG TPA: efflux transporter outer membrane subunit [Candidatus Acidoferrum sp.]|nr:efflux transporter outer membrane subunit [Candidatus Acidoferrum sp.]